MTDMLCSRLLVVGTGSIGITSLHQLITVCRRGLTEKVEVALTQAASRLVSSLTIAAYLGCRVLLDQEGHIAANGIGSEPDIVLVYPASADFIAKVALGMGGEPSSELVLCAKCPVVFCPSMNVRMWESAAVQHNVGRLRDLGYWVIKPSLGIEVATMQLETGGMPSLIEIFRELFKIKAALQVPTIV